MGLAKLLFSQPLLVGLSFTAAQAILYRKRDLLVHLDNILDTHLLDFVDELVVVIRDDKQFVTLL